MSKNRFLLRKALRKRQRGYFPEAVFIKPPTVKFRLALPYVVSQTVRVTLIASDFPRKDKPALFHRQLHLVIRYYIQPALYPARVRRYFSAVPAENGGGFLYLKVSASFYMS